MIFTLSRTGYLAAIVTIMVLIVMVTIRAGKDAVETLVRGIAACIVAVIIAFPMTFTFQRIIPVMVGHPYFFEVEDAAPSARGGSDLNDYKYMSIERFYSLFRQKILGVGATEYNFVDDPYNYDDNGNYLYDEDGNLLNGAEVGCQEGAADYCRDILEDADRSDRLVASGIDGLYIAEAADTEVLEDSDNEGSDTYYDESSTEGEEEVASEGEEEQTSEDGSVDDYSNGRIDIWKAYIKELNLTGHDEMGAVAEDGELLAHAHNVYIQVAYDHGIPVGILFAFVIVAGIAFSGVYYFRNQRSFASAVPFAVITGFAIAGLTEWNFQLCNPMTVALMLLLPVIMFKERKTD